MCGRFETKPSIQSLVRALKKQNIDLELEPNLELVPIKAVNIAPTNKILSITHNDSSYKLSQITWGIKFSAGSPLIFNSRIETITEKKFWNNLFDKNRLIVPMSAFYEWKKEGTKKIPYRIFLPDEELFFVPALSHIDKDKNTFTSLITTTPNDFIKPIHHRMPVILKIKEAINYLIDDPDTNFSKCQPYPGKMQMEQVDL
ncbi:MAG: SOS response-associated peptidase [Ignavibacteriaceae bacterium]